MKTESKKLLKILFISIFFLINQHVLAIEFKTEQEKGVWIKNFFKDKEFEPIGYPINATEEEKEFERQLISDFIEQNGFEHIEPITRGNSLSDPEIAKYNKACPDKKPIDMSKWWPTLQNSGDSPENIERILEEDKYINSIDIYRCHGKIKIYKFNLYNTINSKEEYVLYCDDYRATRMWGKICDINEAIDDFSIEGSYLSFSPEKCLYSTSLTYTHPFWGDAVTGVVKYQLNYYIYTVEGRTNGSTSIRLYRKDGVSNYKSYGIHTKEIIK